MHAILVFPGTSPMDLLADFSLVRSDLIIGLLWYVGLQAKNIHYFWNVIITVQNRLFFHDLIRFCHFSNMLILSVLWHPYSLVLFWCALYIYLIYSSVHVCVTVCDLYTACLACAVMRKSFSLQWWDLGSNVLGPTSPLPDLSQFASLHPQIRPLLHLGKRRHEPSSTISVACRWGARGLCSC